VPSQPLSFDPLDLISKTDWLQYEIVGGAEGFRTNRGFIAGTRTNCFLARARVDRVVGRAAIACAAIKVLGRTLHRTRN
jgi:hypothetical protein